MRMGLPTVPGAPTAQLPSIGNAPSQMFPAGVTGLPSEQIPASGLHAVGNLTPHLPSEIPSSPGFPKMVSTGLPEIGAISAAPQTPGFPSGSFSAGISTPGLAQHGLPSNMETAQGLPRMPTSLTPLNLAGTGQMSLPGFAAGQVPSNSGSLSLGLPSNSETTPGMTGISVAGLPSGVPSVPGLPQIPGSVPTGITPSGLRAGISLPSLPTQSSQSGIAVFRLNPGQLPTGTHDSSFGESGGSMPQIPGLGTRVPLAVPEINSGMSPQVLGMPTDITSAARMVPPSTAIDFPGTAGLGMGGYGAVIPDPQVNSGTLPPGSSEVAGMPTDLTPAAGMVPTSTSIGFSGRAMIPGSQVNFGMVPQDGLFPSSTAIPTGAQRLGDTVIPTNPYAGSVDEVGVTKLQEMGLPTNMSNQDLLVRIDLCESTL